MATFTEFRESLIAAVRMACVAVMFIRTSNDYDTTRGIFLAAELDRLSKPNLLKIDPPIDQNSPDGHNCLYTDHSLWESDVFGFLDDYIKR